MWVSFYLLIFSRKSKTHGDTTFILDTKSVWLRPSNILKEILFFSILDLLLFKFSNTCGLSLVPEYTARFVFMSSISTPSQEFQALSWASDKSKSVFFAQSISSVDKPSSFNVLFF